MQLHNPTRLSFPCTVCGFSCLRNPTNAVHFSQHQLQSEKDEQEQRWADKVAEGRKRVHELEQLLRAAETRNSEMAGDWQALVDRSVRHDFA